MGVFIGVVKVVVEGFRILAGSIVIGTVGIGSQVSGGVCRRLGNLSCTEAGDGRGGV